MISGFYMALILGGKYATNDRAGMLLFYQNRALRLYPTYLLVMLAGWAVFFAVWLVIGKMPMTTWAEPYQQMNWWQKLVMIVPNWSLIGIDLPCHLFFSSDAGLVFRLPLDSVPPVDGGMIWTNQFRSIGPAWSLGLEIWFYLMAPWLARWHTSRLLALAVVSIAVKLWIDYGMQRYSYFFFPAQLHHFIVGMIAQRLLGSSWAKSVSRRACIVVAVLVYAVICLYPFGPAAVPKYVWLGLAFLAIPLLFRLTERSKLDRWLGNLSYSFYLVHLLIWSLLEQLHLAEPHLVALLCTLAAAGIYVFLEEPLDRYRQSRLKRLKQPAMEPNGTIKA